MKKRRKGESGLFTLLSLFRRAARYMGLVLWEGCEDARSRQIKTYQLNPRLLAWLAELGIKQNDRSDHIFTLEDHNRQPKPALGYAPSNYWNFKLKNEAHPEQGFDLQISLGFGFRYEGWGIVASPLTEGCFSSPYDRLLNLRMFRALTESDRRAPAIARKVATSKNGSLAISWADLGLEGIRSLLELFEEFISRNEEVERLAREGRVFDPTPYHYDQPGDELFVTKAAQPRILEHWRQQLDRYRASLAV